jgi:tRNA A37 threonylcarbamoyltransferase TsaD
VKRANDELVGTPSDTNSPWSLYFPPPALCTDNGVMAAWTGIEKFQKGQVEKVNEFNSSEFEPIARWPIGPAISKEDVAMFRKRTSSSAKTQ